jgi:hypothetical protein
VVLRKVAFHNEDIVGTELHNVLVLVFGRGEGVDFGAEGVGAEDYAGAL